MHSFKLKNWKLTLLGLLFVALFARLGFWQLARADEKKLLLKSFAERITHSPLTKLLEDKDMRFYRVKLKGYFDNDKTLLLDNKIENGKIGYEVYTPFKIKNLHHIILVDRGFIPLGESRSILPIIKPILGLVTIEGMLNLPPRYFALGKINDTATDKWPMRVEYLNLDELFPLLSYKIFPYLINLNPDHYAAYQIKWQIVIMGPEKHRAYALQWFALAACLLIICVTLTFKRRDN